MNLPSSMLVARYYNNHDVRIEHTSLPDVLDGEALLRVDASGICGSDVLEWFRLPKSPRILVHKVAGTVVHSRSENLSVGERVVIRNQISCGACHSGYVNVCERGEEIFAGRHGGVRAAAARHHPARVLVDPE